MYLMPFVFLKKVKKKNNFTYFFILLIFYFTYFLFYYFFYIVDYLSVFGVLIPQIYVIFRDREKTFYTLKGEKIKKY